jgi:hypothetical protein
VQLWPAVFFIAIGKATDPAAASFKPRVAAISDEVQFDE